MTVCGHPAREGNPNTPYQKETALGCANNLHSSCLDLVFADVQIDSSSALIYLKTRKSSPVARPEPDLFKLTPPIMIRNGPRPSAIHVPVSNNATHDVDELPTISPDNTQNTVGVGRLAIRSPFTPGPTTAVYYRETTPFTPAPTTAVYHGSVSGVPKHQPTAWQGRFTFFDHFPPEIRERIYRFLIEDVVVIVNAVNFHSVRAFKRQPLRNYRMNFSYITLPYRPVLHPNTNWLSLSRQFFFEARKVFWRSMIVRFERRWDFINASLKGTLVANASKSTPSGMDAPTLFPLRTDVMSHVRELHLNLTTGTDFDGRVTTAEASRVTTSMLEIIEQGMPLLQGLRFIVDDRSRLSNSIIAFLPDGWFLEALLAIKHVDTVSFASGPGWRGHSQNKKNARSCLCAMNAVLAGHFATQHPVLKLDADGIAGVKLQARLGRRMLLYIHAHHELKDTLNALAMKVVMLESNI